VVRDSSLDSLAPAADGTRRRWPSRRLAIGLSPTPRPGLVLVLVGLALGPHGLGVLSEPALASLDPAVSVALAALGVLVGLDLVVQRPRDIRSLGAASVETAATLLLVGGGLLVLHGPLFVREQVPWFLALLAGLCAASSSAAAGASDTAGGLFATRIAAVDDALPMVIAVLAVVWTRPGTPVAIARLIVLAAVIAVAIAFAAWLLITQTSSESEQRVFAVGALLLLGGAAAHLSLSALFAGLLAGLCWNVAGTSGRDALARDMRYLQHPLVVLLLVVAGARLTISIDLVGLVVAYVVLRLAGKRVGGWLAARVASGERSLDPGFSLSSPGVVGIAIALNILQAGSRSDASTTLFAIVVVGSLGSELVSLLISRREHV
jgi:hypothetical protein